MDSRLSRLADHYRRTRPENGDTRSGIRRLYSEYIKGREEKLIDAAAAGAALSGIVLSEDFDPAALSPEMREAFELQFPNIPIDTLSEYSADGLQGFLSPWKGKLFEVIVRDDLNDGAWVGDVHRGAGQVAALADSPTQPGWDLQIFDSDGTVADQLQLKATDQLSYVKHALERYPYIDVLTTTEAAEQTHGIVDGVMSSGISDGALEESVEAAMAPLFDAAQATLVHLLPFLPFVIIIGTEGRRVLMGKKTF